MIRPAKRVHNIEIFHIRLSDKATIMSMTKTISDSTDSGHDIAGVIVAGGVGSRMNYLDKPLLQVAGATILKHIIKQAQSQVTPLLLNVNRNHRTYASYQLPIISDGRGHAAGPLAGILAAMQWIKAARLQTRHLACFPGDTPWFPGNIVELMRRQMESSGAQIVWLKTDKQLQPLFSLWSMSLAEDIENALLHQHYSPRYFIEAKNHVLLELNNLKAGMFFNINDPAALHKAALLGFTDI